MSKPLFCGFLCVASMLLVGCQPSADKGGPAGRPAVSPQAGLDSGPPTEQSEPGDDSASSDADPGMDPNRDKTPAEELPSGDESSQAAPNEGDAEPPARR